jgi:hypothetical protein
MQIHVTYIKAWDESWSHIQDFDVVPRVGEFIVIGGSEHQTYQIVQVVHSLAHHEKVPYCVTAVESQLSHEANLKSEDAT